MPGTGSEILRKVADDQKRYYTDAFLWKLSIAGFVLSLVLGAVVYALKSRTCDTVCAAAKRRVDSECARECKSRAASWGFAALVVGAGVSSCVNAMVAFRRGHADAIIEKWTAERLFS